MQSMYHDGKLGDEYLCVEFQCQQCKQKQWWASSRTLGGRYPRSKFLSCTRDTEIIFRIVHAFTCAGILPSQYIHFTTRANLGTLGPWYISLGELANNKWSDG